MNHIITLEKENFRIDSTDWKKIKDSNWTKVKVNPEWDVWEYLEWTKKWEQLFTKASAIRETKKCGKKLPTSYKIFEDIIEQKYKWDYEAFVVWEDMKFCGWRLPYGERFDDIDKGFSIWCEDGSNFNGNYNGWNRNNDNDGYSFSVRCIQLLDSIDSTIWLFDYLIIRCEENNIWIKKYEELKNLIIGSK
jgi:hypothetical protein